MALPTRVARTMGMDSMDLVSREFGNAIGRLFNVRDVFEGAGVLAPYAVDIRETADHILVDAELPGFRKDDVELTLENSTLTITAERREQTRPSTQPTENGVEGDFLLKERRYTKFSRSFTLPPTVDESKVDAKLVDGILHIKLNKREESKPRKITVG